VKNGKRPTRKQKNIIAAARLNPENWLVSKNLPDCLHFEHRLSSRRRVLKVVIL